MIRLTAVALLVASLATALLPSGCSTTTDSDIIPTTRPVLTTLRPELTTTTTEPVIQRRVYVVQPGDTLGRIAAGFGVGVEELMAENGKEDTILRPGEQLIIPPSAGLSDSGG